MTTSAEPRWWHPAATLVLALGVAMRALPWLLEPLLAWEDGSLFFAANYSEFRPERCVMPYQGYVPFGSNLLAIALCRLPTSCIATAFTVVAILIMAASASAVLRPAWSQVASFRMRLLLGATIAWLPLGSSFEFTTLAYSQWPMLWWLFVLLLEPAPEGRERGLARGVLTLLLTLSHPLAVTLVPLVLLPGVWRNQRVSWACYLGGICGYWAVALAVVNERSGLSSAHWLDEIVPMLGYRVGLDTVLGGGVREWLATQSPWLAIGAAALVWCIFVVLVLVAWRRWKPRTRLLVGALAWLAIATVSASLVGRTDLTSADPWMVRYVWLARVAFAMVLLLALQELVRTRWLCATALMSAVLLTLSHQAWHRHPGGDDGLSQFVQQLEQQEQERQGRRWIRARLNRERSSLIVIQPH